MRLALLKVHSRSSEKGCSSRLVKISDSEVDSVSRHTLDKAPVSETYDAIDQQTNGPERHTGGPLRIYTMIG